MINSTINFNDLSIAREIMPFLQLRLRMLLRPNAAASKTGGTTLIVAPCILGDCLSYLPAILAFAELRKTTFDIIVSPDFLSLAQHIRGVGRIFVASSSYARASEKNCPTAQAIPAAYDRMVVLRLSPEAFQLIRHIKSPEVISSDGALIRYIFRLASSSIFNQPAMQSREVMYDALRLNGTCRERHLYSLFDTAGQHKLAPHHLALLNGSGETVMIHAGCGWMVKQWSDDQWVRLLTQLHASGSYRFLFIGRGEFESQTFDRIAKRLHFPISSLIGQLSLWELFLAMHRCDYFIGIDSGPRNLAHYANLPSVTLLNPAAIKNFMPLDSRDRVVEKPNRFPANIVNTERGATLERIGSDEVFAAFQQLTQQAKREQHGHRSTTQH